MPETESHSWSKFFKGFITGRNYLKAIVLGFCMIIILIIIFSVGSMIQRIFVKPVPTSSVGTNSGTVTTNNEDKRGNSFSLFNIFNSR